MKNLNVKIMHVLIAIGLLNIVGLVYGQLSFENRVKNIIVENADMVIDAIGFKQSAEKSEKSGEVAMSFKGYADNIEFPVSGANEFSSSVVIYEWIDYQCGYCKASYKILKKLSDDNKNITIKYVDYPILGKNSTLAGYVAISAHKQGKYIQYHERMMSFKGRFNKDIIFEQAKLAGLDMAQVKKDIKSDVVKKTIARNIEIGQFVGATGTPFMIAYSGDKHEVINGFIKLDAWKKIIAKITK